MSTERKHVNWSLDQKAIQPIVSGRRSNLIGGTGTISHNYYFPNSNYPNYSNWVNNSAPKGPLQLQTGTYDRLSLPCRPVYTRTPEIRQPIAAMDDNNNTFTSWPAYDSRGYHTISNNYYCGNSLYDNNVFYRNLNPPFTFDAFPNPQEPFPQIRHMNNTYTGNWGSSTIAPTIPHTVKTEVVEKKFLNLVKTVSASDHNWNFNQPLNMFSSRNMASTAADDNLKCTFAGNKIRKLVHNVSGNNFSSHYSKVLPSPKAQNAKTFQRDKNGRNEDRNVPENANSREEDDDLIFLGIVDKNALKKDVEVITISDDEEDGIEVDENKEKFQGELRNVKLEGGGRYGEDCKTWSKFHVVDSTRRVILRKETRNYHFYK